MDIFAIEERIKRLVEKCQTLEQENKQLREMLSTHTVDTQKLQQKNELAITRIETILQRLRTLAGNEL